MAQQTKPMTLFGSSTPYATPLGAEARTFELTVASAYELWLVCTFTGWWGERIWATPPLPFRELALKLTYKSGTLTGADFRWLLERVFRLRRGSETVKDGVATLVRGQGDGGPNKAVLCKLARMVHLYLEEYDLPMLIADVPSAPEPLTTRVLEQAMPTEAEELEVHEAYLQLCFDCVRCTYVDEASYLRQPGETVTGAGN